jgi:hypothetical protein
VESAVCYVSIGDWDKADGIVKLLLLTARDDKNISAKAAYLHGQIEALHKGNPEVLGAIAENQDYISFRSAIYYTLWQASGNNDYRTKLLTEFPYSPEAYSAVDGEKGSSHVAALKTAHWLLFPGREEFRSLTPKEVQPDAGQRAPANPSAKHTTVGAASAKTSRSLQTGLYREKENAALQAARLKADGFNAALAPRTVDGTSFWAVSVSIPEGATMKNTIARLKEHGFDAFPTATQIN